MGMDIEILGGVGVIGMQLNFTAIPTSLFNFLHSLVIIMNQWAGQLEEILKRSHCRRELWSHRLLDRQLNRNKCDQNSECWLFWLKSLLVALHLDLYNWNKH